MDVNVKVEYLSSYWGLSKCEYATPGSAGFDLRSVEDKIIGPGERGLIKTGLKMEIPVGYELQIRPRSGLALKYGLTVINSPGTIDSDYRGELGVILINHGDREIRVERGERIAQGVLKEFSRARFIEGKVGASERGDGGFGSTGIK